MRDGATLRTVVREVVDAAPALDMHTHLFPPSFGAMNLWGVDELLTYHYLVAEVFRASDISYDAFWKMSATQQADAIWKALFVDNTPLSEATRGVVTVFTALGLDPRAKDLREARDFFARQDAEGYVDRVLKAANVSGVVMTNDPFDPAEARLWESGTSFDSRFHPVLRLDPLLNGWEATSQLLRDRDYDARADFSGNTIEAVRRFLDEWIGRMHPLYAAVSLPPDFQYPEDSARARLLREAVLPACREHGMPFAMMIGVRRAVNPALRLGGDGLARAGTLSVERICEESPDNRFLVTMLSREDQHELCVAARKFRNLMPFGCWWFLNVPSIIEEMTLERMELLGPTFIPQHSDARVLDQLLYKWPHSRRVLAEALGEAYARLAESGRAATRAEIDRDVSRLLSGNFENWVGGLARA
jgi:hypothetical protein